jgi:hypothetical protein
MQPVSVIHILDKVRNAPQDISRGRGHPLVDLLSLEGFDKALSMGILIGVTLSTYGDLKVIALELLDIPTRGVLDTAVSC